MRNINNINGKYIVDEDLGGKNKKIHSSTITPLYVNNC
jgi:hypothetical protein